MGRIERTVFISYRRTNFFTAFAVYQNLTANGFDAFIDYQSIRSGDFESVITENIKSRAHFVVILSPSALERCKEPGDWMRREIELALQEKRNIVPLMMEGFDFGSPSTIQALTGKLASLNRYNGLRIIPDFLSEALERLRREYLNVTTEGVQLQTLSAAAKEITEAQQITANNAPPVETKQIISEEWFERGYIFFENKNMDETIRCYTEAIRFKPDDPDAYINRGVARRANNDLTGALADYDQAIRLKPDDPDAYYNRGNARRANNDLTGALADYDQAIRLKPDHAVAYYNRGLTHQLAGNLDGAVRDYEEANRRNPNDGTTKSSLMSVLRKLGRNIEAKEQEELARSLIKKATEYDQACFEAICGNIDKALELLKIGLEKKQSTKEWARQDPDFENIREDPRFIELVGEHSPGI